LRIESAWDRDRARRRVKALRYGPRHRLLRAEIEPVVRSGLARCARCGEPIAPDAEWHLGHDDYDPGVYSGPEHGRCNDGAPRRNVVSRRW
jgi:hypothetical protein